MINKSEKGTKTAYRDRVVWIIFALVVVSVIGYLAYPRSFNSLVETEGDFLQVMVAPLNGESFENYQFQYLSPEVRERIFEKLKAHKYRKEWSSEARLYSDEILIFMSFGTKEYPYTMSLISNGDMSIIDNNGNQNYKVVGGSALFDEVSALIAADAYS